MRHVGVLSGCTVLVKGEYNVHMKKKKLTHKMQSLLREKYPFQFLYMIVVNLRNRTKYEQGRVYFFDVEYSKIYSNELSQLSHQEA